MGMGKQPDVKGASEADRATARDQTYADRPDQYNPWGSVNWGQEEVIDPATGEVTTKWTQSQGLSPDAQHLFDRQMEMMKGRSDLSGSMMGRVQDEFGTPIDWNQFGDYEDFDFDPTATRQQAEDDAYAKQTSRLDPQFAKREEEKMIQLRNRGLKEGDQAYDSAMSSLANERTDAYEQARLGAGQIGRQESDQLYRQGQGSNEMANALRDRRIQEMLGKRNTSLDEMNKINQGQDLGSLTDMTGGM